MGGARHLLPGAELALHIIELRKADRLGLASGPLTAWIELFEHWQEGDLMNQINDEAVRAAYAKLQDLSADAEATGLPAADISVLRRAPD